MSNEFENVQGLKQQYKDSSNLEARIAIHRDYSTNSVEWFSWLFGKYEVPKNGRVLELGCGSGAFWVHNIDRIPSDWDITLSDFSEGMLADAERNLGDNASRFTFKQINIQEIPFEDDAFDVVIANHMLYHVPDRPTAIQEVRRVLKPSGVFYSATNGDQHMYELASFIFNLFPEVEEPVRTGLTGLSGGFSLENGQDQLQQHFGDVQLEKYDSNLHVTDVEPVVAYILSGAMKGAPDDAVAKLRKAVEEKVAVDGAFKISKSTGVFISKN